MVKLTKRKGFNFFRSYYDVYNLLPDADKLAFMDALLDRQFLGIKPTELKGMPEFAYISQTNSIDSQVKGYEDKTKTRLDGRVYYKNDTPPVGGKLHPIDGVNQNLIDPTGQEEEEVQEKGKEKLINNIYNKFVDEVRNHAFDSKIEVLYMSLKIKKGSLTPLLKEFKGVLIKKDRVHLTTQKLFDNFDNWLNVQERSGKLKEYKKNRSL